MGAPSVKLDKALALAATLEDDVGHSNLLRISCFGLRIIPSSPRRRAPG
jgi:hypothetical protein